MHNLLRVSDAVSLAFHTLWLLAERQNELLRTPEIAEILSVSEHHLQKVHQRLAKAGFIRAVRGPKGGFILNRSPEKITLMQIYEAIDGPLETRRCMLGRSTCRVQDCLLGELVEEVNQLVRRHFEKITLAELAKTDLENSMEKIG
ncbi:MAG: Rrf2 family transcriptional regulator [Candidatus Omnitrophica bacterium]|nr:Rrf2 family transcriptional regulator [Candidatus Omnitrophota bacterium]